MGKTIFLICNAHLDPVWQWDWEEGVAETLSTFRTAARFCEEFDGFVFNHNEAILYQWVEQYEPALFERIRRLVAAGKWHIIGGWYLQPDCNMPSGEGFVRQIMAGRRYFLEKFGVAPETAINFDPFGHTVGLVQIMAQFGYRNYLICRPSLPMIPKLFRWRGFAGSELTVRHGLHYATTYGRATEKIAPAARETADPIDLVLWGVGDHGGGPSRKDLNEIGVLRDELKKEGITLIHAAPEDYFNTVDPQDLPVVKTSLNPCMIGCYTSLIRIKQKYRRLENELLTCEKMSAAALLAAGTPYPAEALKAAWNDLIFAQFHDMLPGDSTQPVEDMILRLLDHGLEETSRVRLQAFIALAKGQPACEDGEIPILVYNPHPFPVEGDFSCEMMLWYQNWEGFFAPQVLQNGTPLPTQPEKEFSSIPLDWRKRVVFHATLAPMQMNRFICRFERIPQRPALPKPETVCFANAFYRAEVDSTGSLRTFAPDGTPQVIGTALEIMRDNYDPYGMTVTGFCDRIAEMTPLSPQEGGELAGIGCDLPPVHIIEHGPVRTVAEVLLGYGRSRAVVQYTFSETSPEIGCNIRVLWGEQQKALKWVVKTTPDAADCRAQTAFGMQAQPVTGEECVSDSYVTLASDTDAVLLANDGTYGFSAVPGELRTTLLRAISYCAHPVGDFRVLSADRFHPHGDIGERIYNFRLMAGPRKRIEAAAAQTAALLNEPPFALSFFPAGGDDGAPASTCLEIEGALQLSALKQAEDGNGLILRVFNPLAAETASTLRGAALAAPFTLCLQPYEFRTFRLQNGVPCETGPGENSLPNRSK